MTSFDLWWSDSEEENDKQELIMKRKILRDKSNPLDLPDSTFVKYFRVCKNSFSVLLNIIEENSTPTVRSSSVRPIIKLAAVLRFLAEGSYQTGSGNDFNVGLSQPTFSKSLKQILNILERTICKEHIKFPRTEQEKDDIKGKFFARTGFPGIIGCVDGTHIKVIATPKDIRHLYYNRKGFYSVNVMLVCDSNMRITYVDANYSGSSHDSFIWNCNRLAAALERQGERNTWILCEIYYYY